MYNVHTGIALEVVIAQQGPCLILSITSNYYTCSYWNQCIPLTVSKFITEMRHMLLMNGFGKQSPEVKHCLLFQHYTAVHAWTLNIKTNYWSVWQTFIIIAFQHQFLLLSRIFQHDLSKIISPQCDIYDCIVIFLP